MPPGDCALAETEPSVALSWTGCPQADELLTMMKIAPGAWEPALIAACWHVAPVELGWQLQPSALSDAVWSLRRPSTIELPAGSVIVTVSWLVVPEPVSLTWKATCARLPKYPPL
jgi:hypothetical protein